MVKQYQNSFALLVGLSLIITVSLGCGSISERLRDSAEAIKEDAKPGVTEPRGTTGATSDDGSLTEKTNLYISKCVNKYSNSVVNSYQRYTSWLRDPKAGPTGSERLVYGLYEISGDGEDCAAGIKEANEMEPKIPAVEQAGDKYVGALKEAIKQINAIYPYYNQNDYKDDNFKKGKEANQALVDAFEAFTAANKEFTLEVDKLEDDLAAKRLELYRDDPSKKFAFAVTDFNIKAKKGLVYASRTPYKELSAETLQSNAEEIEAAAAAMKEAGTGNSMASSYFSGAENYVKAYKDLMRRVRDKKPFNSMEQRWVGTSAGWMVEGSPDKVVHEYNSLIRSRSLLRL